MSRELGQKIKSENTGPDSRRIEPWLCRWAWQVPSLNLLLPAQNKKKSRSLIFQLRSSASWGFSRCASGAPREAADPEAWVPDLGSYPSLTRTTLVLFISHNRISWEILIEERIQMLRTKKRKVCKPQTKLMSESPCRFIFLFWN